MSFDSTQALAVGERVIVAVPDRYLFLAALLAHGLPLAALLVGAVVGFGVTRGDVGAVLGSVTGVAGALLAAPTLRKKVERSLLRRVELRSPDAYAGSL
jgi:positive regulator of sigma E activity